MPHLIWIASDVAVLGYLAWVVLRFAKDYRGMKGAVEAGDAEARPRFYRRTLVYEWVSALLALIALGFDKAKLSPALLEMNQTRLGQWFSSLDHDHRGTLARGMVGGISIGIFVGLMLMIFVRLRGRRRGVTPPASTPNNRLRKWIPDFAALIPTTGRERLLFAAVALSAGICEEIVYRGWLLFALHGIFGLTGVAAVLIAAALFGLAHQYQGPLGVFSAALAGLVFCILYVLTGSLLVPIILHSLIDLRLAILPAGAVPFQQTQEV